MFDDSGLKQLPATELPFAGHSSVSLRLRQQGIGEGSNGIGGGPTNRPCSEAGIHLADASGKTAFFLRHRVVFYRQTNEYKHKVELMRRTALSSYTSGMEVKLEEGFIDLRVGVNGVELEAWFSVSAKPKWTKLVSLELKERPATYGVCAFSNADSKTVFTFSDFATKSGE